MTFPDQPRNALYMRLRAFEQPQSTVTEEDNESPLWKEILSIKKRLLRLEQCIEIPEGPSECKDEASEGCQSSEPLDSDEISDESKTSGLLHEP